MEKKIFGFRVTGNINVPTDAVPLTDASSNLCGFRLPDGSEVRLLMCLEVEKEGVSKILSTDQTMKSIGFEVVDYDFTDFEER